MTSGFNANYNTVAVATTATLIVGAGNRRSIIVQNNHATQILYVGDDNGVTTSTGLKIAAGASLTLEAYTGALYGIGSGAATTTNYFEVT